MTKRDRNSGKCVRTMAEYAMILDVLSACQRALSVLVSARHIACQEPMMATPLVTEIQCAGGAVLELQDAIAKLRTFTLSRGTITPSATVLPAGQTLPKEQCPKCGSPDVVEDTGMCYACTVEDNRCKVID